MQTPSIKGAGFAETWARLDELIRTGALSREEAAERLHPATRSLLEAAPEPSLWYPVKAVDELTELLADIEDGGSAIYFRMMGRRAFDSLIERDGFRTVVSTAREFSQRRGESLVKLAGLIYNFGDWSYRGSSPLRFEVEVNDATHLAKFREWTSSGFIERLMAWIASKPVRVMPDRVTKDKLVLRGLPGAVQLEDRAA